MSDLGTSLWLDQAVGHHVDGDLTQMDALALTAKIKAYVGVTWILLSEAHNRRADKALGYANWAGYVEAEFDMGRSYAYRLIAHAKAVYELAEAAGMTDVSPMGDIPERATRGMEIDSIAAEVERQASTLPADASDEDRAEVVKAAVTAAQQTTRTTTTETSTVTFDPETGEIMEDGGEELPVRGDVPPSSEPEPGEEPVPAFTGGVDADGPASAPSSPGSPPVPPVDPTLGYRARARAEESKVRNGLLTLDPARVIATSDEPDHWRQLSDDLHAWLGDLDSHLRGPRLKAVQ